MHGADENVRQLCRLIFRMFIHNRLLEEVAAGKGLRICSEM